MPSTGHTSTTMATPDLSTLTSSAQIFSTNHTLPQIRAIHKQLHVSIDEKAARLRTQVGGSYRELLGTADAIVRMRGEMQLVQDTLGRMGGRCGRAVVGGKVAGLGKFVKEGEDTSRGGNGTSGSDSRSLGAVARARMLGGCVLAVGRLLRTTKGDAGGGKEDRLVVAAKVWVLSQLLVKSFGDDTADAEISAAVEVSKKSMSSLRRRLLRNINKVLKNVGERTERDAIIRALCAYSLATNSGARDLVHHFLAVRGDAMGTVFEIEEHERSTKDVVKSLELYTRTLLDVQFLVPNKLTEALSSLKKVALLEDQSLSALEGLRLDIYEKWCDEEVQQFKPSIRHDDLDGKQARDMLMSWAKKGGEVLLQGLEKTLERTTEFKAIVEMRTDVLQLWIRDGGKAKGFDPSVMLDKLRQTINAHVVEVLSTKVNKLRLVGSEVAATLDIWQAGNTDDHQSLWDPEGFDMDLHNGASVFTQEVISRLYGRNDAVSRAVTGYKSWHQVIDDVEEIVEQLKRQRWDNDVDEIEDEETIDQRQQALSKDDPQKLQERLHCTLEKAFADLDAQLSALWESHKDSANSGQVAMYFLRILRDIRGKLPKLKAIEKFGLGVVSSLQAQIAATVASAPVSEFSTISLTRKMVVWRSLWEGEPELPTSPSPGVFRFLRNLTMAMYDAGTDLWSPTAISVLKQHLGKQLSEKWLQALDAHLAEPEPEVKEDVKDSKPVENGKDTPAQEGEKDEPSVAKDAEDVENKDGKEIEKDEDKAESDAAAAAAAIQRKDLVVQWLFDISMLRCCVGPAPGAACDELKDLEEAVWEKTALEDTAARQRITKTSQEYWKRSSLLFGLLA